MPKDREFDLTDPLRPSLSYNYLHDQHLQMYFKSNDIRKRLQDEGSHVLFVVYEIWQARVCMKVSSTIMSWSNENKSCMRVNESWQVRVCMRVFSTLMSCSNESKSCMRVNESWQVRVCMRVFSTLMSWSNKNKSCMRVDESWQVRVCMRVFSTLMSWSDENKSCMRVDKSWQARVRMRVFSTLMSWSNENKSCMRVDKWEFVWEFSQLSCPGQTRTRVAWYSWWELRSESLYGSFLNSRVLVNVTCQGFLTFFFQRFHNGRWLREMFPKRVQWVSSMDQKAEIGWTTPWEETGWETDRGSEERKIGKNCFRKRSRAIGAYEAKVRVKKLDWNLGGDLKSSQIGDNKQEFVWEFSQFSCPGQTKNKCSMRVDKIKVDKREFFILFRLTDE